MQIGNVKFGVDQIKVDPPQYFKLIANTVIVLGTIVTAIISPMPTEWIPNDVKVYILTVCGSGGLLKVIEKFSGQVEN